MNNKTNFWLSSRGMVAALGIAFLAYFLFVEHGEHIFPYLPYMILLLCPFMHIFMHSGHGNHHKTDEERYRKGYEEGMKQARFEEDQNNGR